MGKPVAEYKPYIWATCEHCGEEYLHDRVSDQCACRDDGSGQYVVDLPYPMCDVCHQEQHLGYLEFE
jgi:hypothetical protein